MPGARMRAVLAEVLRERIATTGPLSVGTYMQLCLGHPEFGYYKTRQPFGAQGDFTTAPEISQLFGEMIGIWAMSMWPHLNHPLPLQLVEFGPGRGTLMRDLWRSLSAVPELREQTTIHLIEFSPALRAIQTQTLNGLPVAWHDTLATVPKLPSLIVMNEFFDALPIEQAVFHNGHWHQRCVDDRNGFVFVPGERLDTPVLSLSEEGALFEYAPSVDTVIRDLCRFIKASHSAAVIIDYGDDVPVASRIGETLQAVKHHRPVSVFETPGQCDLTAHVSFARLRQLADDEKCLTLPLQTQRDFLKQMGIEERAQMLLARATPSQADDLHSAMHRLLDPAQMGILFKVLQIVAA